MTQPTTTHHGAALRCGTCSSIISAGYACRADADRSLAILAEVPSWAVELRMTASGIRGQRATDRRPTRVDPPGVVDEARLALADHLDEVARSWCSSAWHAGCDDLRTSGAYFVVGWDRATSFVAAMVGAERAALDVLDPDEAVLREQRARQAQHAAGGRPFGVPNAASLKRLAARLSG